MSTVYQNFTVVLGFVYWEINIHNIYQEYLNPKLVLNDKISVYVKNLDHKPNADPSLCEI